MELGRGPVELRNGGPPVLRIGDRSVAGQRAPQAVHHVEHVGAARIAHVAAVVGEREVHGHQPPAGLQLRSAGEEDVPPVGAARGRAAPPAPRRCAPTMWMVVAHRTGQCAQPVHGRRGESEVDGLGAGRSARRSSSRRRRRRCRRARRDSWSRQGRPPLAMVNRARVVVAREIGIGDAHRPPRRPCPQRRNRRAVEIHRRSAVGGSVVGDVKRLAGTPDVPISAIVAAREIPGIVDGVLRTLRMGGVVTLVPHRDRRSCSVEPAHAAVPLAWVRRIIGGPRCSSA